MFLSVSAEFKVIRGSKRYAVNVRVWSKSKGRIFQKREQLQNEMDLIKTQNHSDSEMIKKQLAAIFSLHLCLIRSS